MAIITGNRFNNILRSNTEADTIDGAGGIDTVDYSFSKPITVDLTVAVQSGGDAQGDRLISIENVTGSAFADKITGDVNDNTLNGGRGSDTLNGGDGKDTLIGGVDGVTDYLDGGTGIDGVSYASSTYAVTVTMGLNGGWGNTTALETFGELQRRVTEDKFIRVENVEGSSLNDTITGNEADNVLNGGRGDDFINGGDGADTIIGGGGADYMIGGLGADTFVFQLTTDIGTGASYDHLSRFQGGQDKIDLSAIDAVTGNVGNDAFHFSTSFGAFDGTAGALVVSASVYDDFGQQWNVKGDVNGDGQADFTLSVYSLYSSPSLSMSDFVM